MNKEKHSFMFYPEITDNDFNEKIYIKKEFRDSEIKDKVDWNKTVKKSKEFLLDPHQIFLKNYISPETPYNGILIFHGTGVGKTCTSLSIAEGFKKTLKNNNKKILIIGNNLKENFVKELYDEKREKDKVNPDDIVQCTGRAYELGEESLYLTKEQKEKTIRKLKYSYYQFFGYTSFVNYINQNTNGWKGDEKDVNEKIKKFISKEFDNRVIIIDEIQNIKTEKKEGYTRNIQPMLQSIIKYGKSIKLILMSATPIFDRPDEIIFYINLLLLNDRRKPIEKSEIFNSKDGTLKSDAEKILRDKFKGYVSYIRGEKPIVFPFRIYPSDAKIPKIEYTISGKKIEDDKQIQFTKIILCSMKDTQLDTYNYYLNNIKEKIKLNLDEINDIEYIDSGIINEKKDMRLLLELTAISNITYPIVSNNIGSFSKLSINSDFDNGNGGYYKNIYITEQKKKKIKYRYQSHAIMNKGTINEMPFASEKYLYKYSTKFAKILDTVKKSIGSIFIFSQYVEQGVLPLALILEQAGFERACNEDEENLLDYTATKLKNGLVVGGLRDKLCSICMNRFSHKDHSDKNKTSNYHIAKPARYILFFGESKDIIKITKKEALDKFCSEHNKYGQEIKVFLGTRTVGEGLDFKRIRQVHIVDPWYNLSRHEQIIGRAIRNYSHKGLLPEENNVEIYQYASITEDYNNKPIKRESIDLKNYRLAENKDIIIKNITRIMKESAVDCVLFRNTNIIDSDKKIKQITSSGKEINMLISDNPYSSICDYKEKCNFTCNWMPNPRIKYPINTDTYNINFASIDIDKAKKIIKNLFRSNIVYHLGFIENIVTENIPNIDKIFIYSAIEQLVDNKNEIIYDKFNRMGYIIYRGDYYIFQPFDLERDEIPLIYRMNPTDIKKEYVELDNIKLEYSHNQTVNNNKIDEIKFIDNILKNIDNIYNLHKQMIEKDKNKYIFAIIGTIIDKLNITEEYIFIKNILTKYLQSNTELYINDIINYLNFTNKLINYYADILFDSKKIKNNIYVGFIIHDKYYILNTIDTENTVNILNKNKNKNDLTFINCSVEIINKIKSHRNIGKKNTNKNKVYNIIYGVIEYNKKKQTKSFKIIDKSIEEEILTKEKQKSKRSIITGRICSTFQINKLLEIRTKLGMYSINSKRRIDFICEDIEIYLRYKQLLNNDNKIWIKEMEL